MMAVDVVTDRPRFDAAVPHVLFQTRASSNSGPANPYRQYDVMPDGQSFLINERTPENPQRHDPLTVILNWTSLLHR
jgi:hypothetical protein